MTILEPISFFLSPLFIKTTEKSYKLGNGEPIKLRDFQHDLLNVFLDTNTYNVVILSAPTGAGKTLTLLTPLFANLEGKWFYHGSVGIYPSRELARDQMDSISNMLTELGAILTDTSKHLGEQQRETIDYLRVFEFELEDYGRIPIVLALITSESLRDLRKAFGLQTNKEVLEHLQRSITGNAFRIIFTVPEYPYLLGTSTYRDFHKAGVWLYAVLEELVKLLSVLDKDNLGSARINHSIRKWFQDLEDSIGRKRVFEEYYVTRKFVNELSDLFLLFRAPVFFDEFHLYAGLSLAAFISLLYIYLLQKGIRKIVIASATPEKTVLVKGKKKDFLELVRLLSQKMGYKLVRLEATISVTPKSGFEQIRKKTMIKVIPVILRGRHVAGAPAYGVIQRHVPEILEKTDWLERYREKNKAMIIVDRVASVLEVREAVEKITGETPLTICSVRKLFQETTERDYKGLKSAKLIVGNLAIAFGVDIKGMDLGVVVAKDYLSALQKIGRFGRGSGNGIAEIYLPIPLSKYKKIEDKLQSLQGREIPYIHDKTRQGGTDFISLLKLLYPKFSPDILIRKRIGVLKAIIPSWVYTFSRIIGERDTIREKLHMAKKIENIPILSSFAMFLNELENFLEIKDMKRRIRSYLRNRVLLTPKGIHGLYSFRNIVSVTVRRDTGDRVMEEQADLTTVGRNISLKVVHGEFIVDERKRPYEYTVLWIGMNEKSRDYVVEVLKLLNRNVVNIRFLLELLGDHELYLFQGTRKLCRLNILLENEELAEAPIYVMYPMSEKTNQIIKYLGAVESLIPIYTYNYYGGSYTMEELLGGIFTL